MSEPGRAILSVVIAGSDSEGAVARTLASLSRCDRSGEIEILKATGGVGVPRLRRLGLDAASGEVVVFTEDSCVFERGWVAGWLEAFSESGVLAATGPVRPAMGDRAIDWSVFFCEYAPFLPGGDKGRERVASRLAGNNFAIKSEVKDRLDGLEIHESCVPGELKSCAHAHRAIVGHVRKYAVREAFRDRLRFGFMYGRQRAEGMTGLWRMAGFVVGPLILLSQAGRLCATIAYRKRYLGEFIETLALTLGLLTAWSVGE